MDGGREAKSNATLRVLLLCGADFRSPTEKVALGYALGLVELGHEAMIGIRGNPATAEAEMPEGEWRDLGIFAYGFRGPLLRPVDRRRAADFRPDVIHAFNPRFDVIKAARSINRATGVPLVVHFEDDEWGLAAGRDTRGAARRAARLIAPSIAHAYPPAWRMATSASLAWVRENAAALEAITPELAAHVSAELGRDCSVLLPVHPGIGHAISAPAEPDLPAAVGDRECVVFTGAVFAPHAADFCLLLDAMGELKRRGRDIALLYAGTSASRFDLRAWARGTGLGDADFYDLGYLDSAEMQGLLRRATVLVQPGAPTEFNRLRLPSKLQTYLASGTPTVTFACGAGELFEDREEVLKTHGSDPLELADTIGELLADPELRRRLSANGPAAAERLFDRLRNTETLVGIYRHAIEALGTIPAGSPPAGRR